MTIICRPVGRGNWHTMRMSIEGSVGFLGIDMVGQRFQLGGITWRVCAVEE